MGFYLWVKKGGGGGDGKGGEIREGRGGAADGGWALGTSGTPRIGNRKWYLDTGTDILPWTIWSPRRPLSEQHRGAYTVWVHWTQGWFMSQEGQRGTARGFIILLRMVHNFWNCAFNISDCSWMQVTESTESETVNEGDYCIQRTLKIKENNLITKWAKILTDASPEKIHGWQISM